MARNGTGESGKDCEKSKSTSLGELAENNKRKGPVRTDKTTIFQLRN